LNDKSRRIRHVNIDFEEVIEHESVIDCLAYANDKVAKCDLDRTKDNQLTMPSKYDIDRFVCVMYPCFRYTIVCTVASFFQIVHVDELEYEYAMDQNHFAIDNLVHVIDKVH
jgi:hypothetical protein